VTTGRALTHAPWESITGLVHGFLPGRAEPTETVHAPRQVHGTRVVTLDRSAERPEADGLVTADAGVRVGVVTADCVPILMLAQRRRAVAAVHAGWRGAAAGVVEGALAHLRSSFGVEPAELQVAMGPAIGACCYEVGPEVRTAFTARTGDLTAPAWSRRGERDVVDLRIAIGCLLAAAGVARVGTVGPCTRCSAEYSSYRRDGTDAARQWSFIGWS
jgi:YfiH family protein